MNTQKGADSTGANPKPTTSDTLILPEGVGDWIVKNSGPLVDVIAYLKNNPADFNMLATLARLSVDGGALFYKPYNPRAQELVEARQRSVREWLYTGHLAACPRCVAPIVAFGNGVFLDLRPQEHQCGKVAHHAA